MTRRTRRRLLLLGSAAAAAVSVPLWVPHLLAGLPAFRVSRIEVVGTRYVPPDEVVRLAAVDSTASVWDDPGIWEARVSSHRLIRQARVHRRGLRTLEIRVVEDRPVALAATPLLVPVNAEGRLLPLDPAEASLDLPLLAGTARIENGRLESAGRRHLARVLGRLEEYDPAFTRGISEIGTLEGGAVEIRLVDAAHCARILLPPDSPVLALRRVEIALGAAGRRALLADARFEGQVVLRLDGGA
ncbi:MAG: cell division protein FtsQ/DivIB [Gemmatimonadota bacterium]